MVTLSEIATISRTDAGLGADPARIGDVHWTVATSRPGLVSAGITVRYTDAEVAGLVESHLRLLQAPSSVGPFFATAGSSVDVARNEVQGVISSPTAVLIIADIVPPTATITRLLGNPTANQNPAWSIVFDEDVGTLFTTDDIMPTGSLAGAVGTKLLTGSSPNFTVQFVTTGENLDGTLGFDIVAGAVADTFGASSLAAAAPAYTIAESGSGVLAGDVDKNGVVNVADVTLLSNFIGNGAPPLP